MAASARRTTRMMAIAALLMALVPAPGAGGASFAGTFADDDGSVHEPNIEAIVAAGITVGCGPDVYCPSRGVTRAQMASFLARAVDLSGVAPDAFPDDNGSVHEANINLIAQAGITLGCGDGLYCPDETVSRGQMASFVVRAISPLDPATDDYFLDDTGSPHEAAINVLRENNISVGCNEAGNFFCPTEGVSRAQMASFLARALGLDPITPTPPPSNDPDYYTTPVVAGTGQRTINVPAGGVPSLASALAGARPGDTIVLGSGTHTLGGSGDQVLTASGTATAWIEIRGADGVRPVLDLGGSGELRLSGSHVYLHHLEIRNGAGNNLHVAPEATDIQNVVVRDIRIADLATGPGAAIMVNRNNDRGTAVARVYIESCDVSGAIDNAVIDGVGAEQVVVRDCWIHDNEAGSPGIFFKGGSAGILIEGNLISGISGDAALQLGGNTDAELWNPAHRDWEGVDQVARNNLIADFDDSGVEVRGVQTGRVYHNTIVTQTSFAVFRLQLGNTASGGTSDNDDIEFVNNLVIGTGGDPQYARNDGTSTSISFVHQLWGGVFHNSVTPTPGVPQFPTTGDVVVGSSGLPFVVLNPSAAPLTGRGEALARYRPVSGSIAVGSGIANDLVAFDIFGDVRSATAPTLGAIERP